MNSEQISTAKTNRFVRLYYPSFDGECRVILSGETVKLDCVCSIQPEASASDSDGTVNGDNGSLLLLQSLPYDTSPLILHPVTFLGGERTTVCFTNASRNVCIITKDSFDIASRLGHGIFRHAEVIPYERPIARGFRLPLPQEEKGVCAS